MSGEDWGKMRLAVIVTSLSAIVLIALFVFSYFSIQEKPVNAPCVGTIENIERVLLTSPRNYTVIHRDKGVLKTINLSLFPAKDVEIVEDVIPSDKPWIAYKGTSHGSWTSYKSATIHVRKVTDIGGNVFISTEK